MVCLNLEALKWLVLYKTVISLICETQLFIISISCSLNLVSYLTLLNTPEIYTCHLMCFVYSPFCRCFSFNAATDFYVAELHLELFYPYCARFLV
jgi:hypothetical protein